MELRELMLEKPEIKKVLRDPEAMDLLYTLKEGSKYEKELPKNALKKVEEVGLVESVELTKGRLYMLSDFGRKFLEIYEREKRDLE